MGDEKDLYTNLFSSTVKFFADKWDATPSNSRSSLLMSSLWQYMDFDLLKVYRSKFVCQLFSLLSAVGTNDLYLSLVNALCNKSVHYPVQETLGPVVIDVYKSTKFNKDGLLQVILTYCVSQLGATLKNLFQYP